MNHATFGVPGTRLEGVPAPAKLNLFLHVTGLRADGYHLLQSVFMLIDWCDKLDFELRHDGRVLREDLPPFASDPHGAAVPVLPEMDLCVRAAQALQAATGCTLGVHIGLRKHIPAEAGMGGGSSDAATCLIALNRLWGLGLSRSDLASIGAQLGADVPFFIGGRNAWVEGVGEQLTPISLPATRFLILKPPSGASTRLIFASEQLQRNTKTAIIQGFAANPTTEPGGLPSTLWANQLLQPLSLDLQKILAFGRNDLQPVVQAMCPDIERGLQWLSAHGLHGRMTGSGTALFAPVSASHRAVFNGDSLPAGWVLRECSNLDVHPLLNWCPD
jgi:4-diphosphocytidyl-2-C-methyl-D-erythritol kinase